jgi:hypothetical protein
MIILFFILAMFSIIGLIVFYIKSPRDATQLAPLILSTLGTTFTILGVILSRKQSQSGDDRRQPPASPQPFRLDYSLQSAFLGGVLGGGTAGLINGVIYWWSFRTAGEDFAAAGLDSIIWTFAYAIVTGGVFGTFCQFFVLVFRQSLANLFVSDALGGIIGGGLTGAVMGVWAGWLFASRNTPPPDNFLIFWGGIVCGVGVVLGTLLYEQKDRGRTIKRTLIILAPVTLIVGSLGLFVLLSMFHEDYFVGGDLRSSLARGAIFGAVMATLWGLQLGLTQGLYRITARM